MSIAFLVLAILVTYFDIATFNLKTEVAISRREVRMLGEALLSCQDLTEISPDNFPVKALFLEEKLINYDESNPPCLQYPKKYKAEIGSYTIGDMTVDSTPNNSTFPVAIKRADGSVELELMNIFVS